MWVADTKVWLPGVFMFSFLPQKDALFQQFLIAVSLEGLENKYSMELSRGQVCMFGEYVC